MYIVSVLSSNVDFLESLPQAILNYNLGDLKFYFFSSLDQLNQQVKQRGLPDLLLCDRDFQLGEGWGDDCVHKVYLSEVGNSKEEIFLYLNTELFLLEIQRRISKGQAQPGSVRSQMNKGNESRLTWFLDLTESEWGKSCFNDWMEVLYQTGKSALCLDFSKMGILDRGKRLPSPHNLSEVLQCWLYKRGQFLEERGHLITEFLVVEGVKHPMDLEMLRPEFIENFLETVGTAYEKNCLYSSLCNESLTKCLLRYAEEIILISDQPDIYEGKIFQLEAWLKEINPRGQVTIIHSRSDPHRKVLLKKKILDRITEKGRTS